MDLIINSFGTSLSRDNGGFTINTSDGRQHIPVTGIKSIHISRGAQITSDAVMLAVENEIEILFIDKGGDVSARVWSPKYGSVSSIRKGQLSFTFSHDSVEWIKGVIMDKIENQQALLLTMPAEDMLRRNLVDKAVNRLEDYRSKVSRLQGEIVSDISATLRGWEGVASKIYFDAANLFLPERYRFDKRSQHPAMDVTNAMLNYGYGLLYGKIESALIKAGVDPYIGIMHRDDYNRPVLVYDIIESYRVWVDYVVFKLLSQDVITDEHYSVRDDGSCWLEALGRRILIQSINDFLDEVTAAGSLRRSRLTQISLKAQEIAQMFKKYD